MASTDSMIRRDSNMTVGSNSRELVGIWSSGEESDEKSCGIFSPWRPYLSRHWLSTNASLYGPQLGQISGD